MPLMLNLSLFMPMNICPVSIRSNVDLPAPFAPTSMTFEFGSTTQSRPTMLGSFVES
jgi:hypothetical protein